VRETRLCDPMRYCLLTAGYIITGKLSLLLAVPPGYASPVFPPAGIAIAAMLIAGPATLPWSFLGSFLLNMWIAFSMRQSAVIWFAGAVAIAAGSTLQGAIGGTVLRRAVGYPAPLDNGRDLGRFLILSPICCLTSATLSLGSLLALGALRLPDFTPSWISFWFGDTLGLLVMLPLMLIIAGEPRPLWRSRAKPVALPMLLFFALFVAIFVQARTWAHDDASWGILVSGVVSTGLLGAFLLLNTGYTRRVETMVEERTRDLLQAEAALHRAQKMEAIGELTGRIAHDFNNLLTVVSGNAILLHNRAPNAVIARHASAIIRAAERGERLIRQLLTFSRRQTLRPEAVDLRQRTHEITELFSGSLRGDIEIIVEIPENLWLITVDPAEFELALLNLGVNARDAMPNGGRFRVEAHNTSLRSGDAGSEGLTGDFVAMKMSDTGTGMTPAVLAQAFEPFFTTKAVGQGSGIGLSQVYGFAKQSGGAALIKSEVGRGTSITLFLPRSAEAVAYVDRARRGETELGETELAERPMQSLGILCHGSNHATHY
jgi:signal transduction histidine kinase